MSWISRNTYCSYMGYLLGCYFGSIFVGFRNCNRWITSLLCFKSRYFYFNLQYFIASLAGKKHEELEEMLDDSKLNADLSKLTCMDKLKVFLYRTLKNHAFIVVTLCASVISILYLIILDTKPSFWFSRINLWSFFNTFQYLLWCNFHRKGNNQSFNSMHLCDSEFLRAPCWKYLKFLRITYPFTQRNINNRNS